MSGRDRDQCRTAEAVRRWLQIQLERFYPELARNIVNTVPVPKLQGVDQCELDEPHVWISRNDTETEDCLEQRNHPVLVAMGRAGPPQIQAETFDVEIWSMDPYLTEDAAADLRELSPAVTELGDNTPFLSDITITNQADDYFARGAHVAHRRGGAIVASVQLRVRNTGRKKPPRKRILPWFGS